MMQKSAMPGAPETLTQQFERLELKLVANKPDEIIRKTVKPKESVRVVADDVEDMWDNMPV